MTSAQGLLLPIGLSLAVALGACSRPAKPVEKTKAETAAVPAPLPPADAPAGDAPAGDYVMDLSHTSVNFRVSHLGLSYYTARFTEVDGKLAFDPAHPSGQSVTASIDARSLQTNYPDPAELDFDTKVEDQFFDAANHPRITFVSTRVEPTGPRTARVIGDLSLHGVTRPVTLAATFNGGYKAGQMDPSGARIGFSATGAFRRSDFGIGYGIPAPGTTMGVGDVVQVTIESEFTRK